MSMEIKQLPNDVRETLKSGLKITDATQCVLELVYNSLDAKSLSIAVRVDLKKFYIQVVDNGCGINKHNLKHVGDRYMTSKCYSINAIESILPTFGYTGCALASIANMCTSIELQTRTSEGEVTYIKVIKKGNSKDIKRCKNIRPSQGTTVTVNDLFVNMPVRRKRIKEIFDIEDIKLQLEALAVINPEVSFSLRNDASGKVLLQTHANNSRTSTMADLFRLAQGQFLQAIRWSENDIKVSGFISKQLHSNSTLQFIYVNQRIVSHPKIQNLIVNLMGKYGRFWEKSIDESSEVVDINGYVFLIQILCPYTKCIISKKGRKTYVDFLNMEEVMKTICRAVKAVIREDNRNSSLASHSSRVESLEEKRIGNPDFGPSQLEHAVQGREVSRKLPEEAVSLMETSDDKTVSKRTVDGDEGEKYVTEGSTKRCKILAIESKNSSQLACPSANTTGIQKYLEAFFNQSGQDGTGLALNAPIFELPIIPQVTFHEFFAWLKVKSRRNLEAKNLLTEFLTFKSSQQPKDVIFRAPKAPRVSLREVRKEKLASRGRILLKQIEKSTSNDPSKLMANVPSSSSGHSGMPHYQRTSLKFSERYYCEADPLRIRKLGGYNLEDSVMYSTWKSHYRDGPKSGSNLTMRQTAKSADRLPFLENQGFNSKHMLSHRPALHNPMKSCNGLHQREPLVDIEYNSPWFPKVIAHETPAVLEKETFSLPKVPHPETPQSFLLKSDVVQCSEIPSVNDPYNTPTNHFLLKRSQHIIKEVRCQEVQTNPDVRDKSVQTAEVNNCHVAVQTKIYVKSVSTCTSPYAQNNAFTQGQIGVREDRSQGIGDYDEFEKSDTYLRFRAQMDLVQKDSQNEQNLEDISEILGQAAVNSCPEIKDKEFPEGDDLMISMSKIFRSNPTDDIPHDHLATKKSFPSSEELILTEVRTDDNLPDTVPTVSLQEVHRELCVYSTAEYKAFDPPVSSTLKTFDMREKVQGVPEFEFKTNLKKVPPLTSQRLEEFQSALVGCEGCSPAKRKWNEDNTGDQDVRNRIISELEDAPAKKCVDPQILSARNNKLDSKIQALINPINFSKDSLTTAQVVGQLDKKFIIISVNLDGSVLSKVIAALDQHAVHERIKLESLLDGYRSDEEFTSEVVEEPITFTVIPAFESVIKKFRDKFKRFGLQIKNSSSSTVTVTSLPSCFLRKHEREVKGYRESSLHKRIKDLVIEICGYLQDTRGAVPGIPKAIMDVVASEACRGAIKFDTELSLTEMKNLILELQKCKLPFQCAHGRPSIVPLFNLNDHSNKVDLPTLSQKLNLRKFKKMNK